MMSPKVIIVGCGIAGPVLALLLKAKGYETIVLEKVTKLGDAGASLLMNPNGLKVLSLVNLSSVITESSPHIGELRDQSSSGNTLGVSRFPTIWQAKYGQPACGIKRTEINLLLKEALIREGVEILEGWQLDEIIEEEAKVIAISSHGQRIEGEILIGCDGIKSVVRSQLQKQKGVGEEKAEYTGLTQTAGMSPTPDDLKARPGLLNLYGPGAHFICYPVSPDTTSWAITLRDPTEAQETWRIFSSEERASHRDELLQEFRDWSSPVPELIRGVERMIKYGLYDRPHLEPEQWYSTKYSRCVLIGDAAHPTSPHLGQGANQALEDCYHLSSLLPDFRAQPKELDTTNLRRIFSEFAQLRQPRTAALVKGARAQGEKRVIEGGAAACQERDNFLIKSWEDHAAVEAKYDALMKEPF